MIRVVFDTNIIVSALLQPLGPPAQLLTLTLASSIQQFLFSRPLERMKKLLRIASIKDNYSAWRDECRSGNRVYRWCIRGDRNRHGSGTQGAGSASVAALWPLWPTAISYAVSFLSIAIVWINPALCDCGGRRAPNLHRQPRCSMQGSSYVSTVRKILAHADALRK